MSQYIGNAITQISCDNLHNISSFNFLFPNTEFCLLAGLLVHRVGFAIVCDQPFSSASGIFPPVK